MDKFVINGPTVLKGKIRVDGSKNAALPILAATLLIDKGVTVIRNVPPLQDIYTLSQMLEYIGAKVTYDGKSRVVTVNAEKLTQTTAPYDLMCKMRGSFLVLGPLLARLGEARVSLPGVACWVHGRWTIISRGLPLSVRRLPKKAVMSSPKGNRLKAAQSISTSRPTPAPRTCSTAQ